MGENEDLSNVRINRAIDNAIIYKLKAENAELRSLGTTMSDSFDKVSDECMRLKAQLALAEARFKGALSKVGSDYIIGGTEADLIKKTLTPKGGSR